MAKESKITNTEMMAVYDYYIANISINKHRTEYEVLKRLKPFIQLMLCKSKVYKQYWNEFYNELIPELFRAFETFEPQKNVKLFGWVWKISLQCAWRFIRDKENEIKYSQMFIDTDFTYSDDEYEYENISTTIHLPDDKTPEIQYIYKEQSELAKENLNYLLDAILYGVLDKEVYTYKNGLSDCEKLTNDEIAVEMNLTPSTVKSICKRNSNRINGFKKFLNDNNISEYDKNVVDMYVSQLHKKNTSR